MLYTKFGWSWPSGSGEDENVKSLQTDGQTDLGKLTNYLVNHVCAASVITSNSEEEYNCHINTFQNG